VVFSCRRYERNNGRDDIAVCLPRNSLKNSFFRSLVQVPFPPLNNYVRISIGTMDEMRQGMDVFRRLLAAT
jgi:hypothetical protein